MINTSFWSDTLIQDLDINTKLFFLYLLTNEHTDICGIYEISIKTMCFESGLSEKAVFKSIDSLSKTNRINYTESWVFIKNFGKHQQNNPKVQRGIEIGLDRVPKAIYDRLSIDYGGLSHSNPNPNPNSNPNSKAESLSSKRGKLLAFGEEKTMKLSQEEYLKLCRKIGRRNATKVIQKIENWKLQTGKGWKNDYRGLLGWVDRDRVAGNLKISWEDFFEEDFESNEDYEKMLNLYQ